MSKAQQQNTNRLYFSNRITEALEGILDHPLTIIEAPMGYGKTTAAREYLSNASVNVFWQKVYDSSIESFWNGFIKLFCNLDDARCQSLISLGFPDNGLLLQETIRLIKEIKMPAKTVLVVDDYHLVDNSSVDVFFEFLAEEQIPNLHIVMTARFARLLRLEELKLKCCLHHITKDTFELNPDDIMKYYHICGISLGVGEAQQLYSYTEGWISALYLLMLEYVAEGSYTRGESIYNLLEKAVYVPLSDEMKDFVVTLSIFDSFTSKQARFMWGKENTRNLLAQLTRNNSFVTYDSKLKTYNFHTIFIEFLKEVFEEKEATYKNDLYRKAAQWFMEKGDYFSARRYYYKCRDFDSLLLALEKDTTNDYTHLNTQSLKKYLTECPEEVKKRHHYALLIYAMHLFVHKELELFNKTCNELKVNIEMDNDLEVDRRHRLLGELELLLSFADFNDLNKMSAHHQKAWQLLKNPTALYDTSTNWTFGSPSVLSLYYRESGRLAEHIKDLKDAMPYYNRLTSGHGLGAEYAMEGEFYFNQGDFDNAEISVQKALLKAQQTGKDDSIVLSAKYFLILIAFMKGDLAKMMNLLTKMREYMESREDYHFIHTAEICESCIYAYLDQIDKIPAKLLEVDLTNLNLRFPAVPFFNVMYGRVLLIQREYLKLIGCADHFIAVSSVFSNLLGYVYTYIYLAAAYRKIFREEEALSSLRKALEIAIPDKQYMLFVENCDYIEPLLRKIALAGDYRSDIKRILTLYETFQCSKERLIAEHFTKEMPQLTPRQEEIARLAAEGLTNKKIGKKLYISVNTVKKTLQSIYEKLSINNRVLLRKHFEDLDQ